VNNAFLAEGDILINEALKSGIRPIQIFLREDDFSSDEEISSAVAAGLPADADIALLPKAIFNGLAMTETPQPVIAVLEKPAAVMLSPDTLLKAARTRRGIAAEARRPDSLSLVVLDRLQDPGNVGTILRSADAASFDAVVALAGTADVFSPKVCRAAAGSAFRMPVLYAKNAEETMAVLVNAGITPVALQMGGTPFTDAELSGDTALIVGNEGEGLQPVFIKKSKLTVSVPMQDEVESLNVGVAASVVMYEKIRQDKSI